MTIKPWMLAACAGGLFGLMSRRWLAVEMGRGHTVETDHQTSRVIYVVIGVGNTINHNHPSPAPKETAHAEGA